MVEDIAKDIEVGQVYEGTVARIMNFGAFIELGGGKEGLLHISKISKEMTLSFLPRVILVFDGVICAAYAEKEEKQKQRAALAVSSFFVNLFIISSLLCRAVSNIQPCKICRLFCIVQPNCHIILYVNFLVAVKVAF